jgi:hypothetical protein
VLGVTLAICASVGVGVGAEWRWGERAHAVTRRVLDVLLLASATAWTTAAVVTAALLATVAR